MVVRRVKGRYDVLPMAASKKRYKKSSSKRKKSGGGGGKGSGGGGGGGGGGVMMSMRSGFKNVAHSAVGAGGKKKTQRKSKTSQALNWGFTVILLCIAAWLLLRRLGYI